MIEPASASGRETLAARCIFAVALLASLALTHVGWQNKLLDTHPFRQTQTALSTYWMNRDGVSLDYITPVMGAPWAIPMEFPVYEAAVVAVVHATGMPLDSAGRAVSLFFFFASLPALYLLLRRLGLPELQRWLFLSLVLTSPIYLFYSRTFLIESTAFCLGLWFLVCFAAALQPARRGAIAGAIVFGLATGLAKVTTYAVVLVPALLLGFAALRREPVNRAAVWFRGLLAALPGVVAAAWWVWHTDLVKARNVVGVTLTSVEERDWVYGPFALRFELSFWKDFIAQLTRAVAPGAVILVAAVLALIFVRGRARIALSLLACAFAGPLVFANLYQIHDYYLYSNGIFFLALLALPLQQMFEHPHVPAAGRWGAFAAVVAAQLFTYFGNYFPMQRAALRETPEIARVLQHVTKPDDVFVGLGMNWSSILPYYAERRALMIPDRYLHDDPVIAQSLKNLGRARVAALVLFVPGQAKTDRVVEWLRQLAMDETPFAQTGEYSVFLRKDIMPDALKSLTNLAWKDIVIYEGKLAPPGKKTPIVYWTDQMQDRRAFSMMSPQPVRTTVPFDVAATGVDGRLVFIAHTPTEVEIHPLPGQHRVTAQFGMNRECYNLSDGVEFEVVQVLPNGVRQTLYHRFLQPRFVSSDRGFQELSVETDAALEGALLFRTLPGPANNDSYDWAFWSAIQLK